MEFIFLGYDKYSYVSILPVEIIKIILYDYVFIAEYMIRDRKYGNIGFIQSRYHDFRDYPFSIGGNWSMYEEYAKFIAEKECMSVDEVVKAINQNKSLLAKHIDGKRYYIDTTIKYYKIDCYKYSNMDAEVAFCVGMMKAERQYYISLLPIEIIEPIFRMIGKQTWKLYDELSYYGTLRLIFRSAYPDLRDIFQYYRTLERKNPSDFGLKRQIGYLYNNLYNAFNDQPDFAISADQFLTTPFSEFDKLNDYYEKHQKEFLKLLNEHPRYTIVHEVSYKNFHPTGGAGV